MSQQTILDEIESPPPSVKSSKLHYLLFFALLFIYLGLVLLDKDTHHWRDVLNIRILPGMLLYVLPPWVISSFLLRTFVPRYGDIRGFFISLIIGSIITITTLILGLTFLEAVLGVDW